MKTLDTEVLAEITARLVAEFHPEQIILKTHNVVALVADASALGSQFSALLDAARLLTPDAVAYRSPRSLPDPTEDEGEAAIGAATEIDDFVLLVLPSETHPA